METYLPMMDQVSSALMSAAIAWMTESYGSPLGYIIQELGVTEDEIAALRDRFLERGYSNRRVIFIYGGNLIMKKSWIVLLIVMMSFFTTISADEQSVTTTNIDGIPIDAEIEMSHGINVFAKYGNHILIGNPLPHEYEDGIPDELPSFYQDGFFLKNRNIIKYEIPEYEGWNANYESATVVSNWQLIDLAGNMLNRTNFDYGYPGLLAFNDNRFILYRKEGDKKYYPGMITMASSLQNMNSMAFPHYFLTIIILMAIMKYQMIIIGKKIG